MKTALITGATSGIGREIAKSLASKGWRTLIHGRNLEKTEAACRACGDFAEPFVSDLSLTSEAFALAAKIRSRFPNIDALVLNAGTITKKREVTAEGIGRMFAVNHLAPFILTKELLPTLSKDSHILSVSTEAHSWIKTLDLENLQAEKKFRVLKHYAATKAANLMATLEWARHLDPLGIQVSAHHPGEVATSFGLHGPLWLCIFWKLSSRRFLTPAQAAAPLVAHLIRKPHPSPSTPYYSKGQLSHPAPFILDTELQRQVWDLTESLLTAIST